MDKVYRIFIVLYNRLLSPINASNNKADRNNGDPARPTAGNRATQLKSYSHFGRQSRKGTPPDMPAYLRYTLLTTTPH